jgi:hypothetical protein
MRHALMLGGVAALVAGCVLAGPSASAASDAQMSQIRNACAANFNPSEAPFAYCVASMREQAQPRYVSDDNTVDARRTCAAVGYGIATAQYDTCVGNLAQTLSDRARPKS